MSETEKKSHILDVHDLEVEFETDQGIVHAVRGVTYEVNEGEIVGLVGESGSGKSVSMYSVMGLLAENGHIRAGDIKLDGRDIARDAFANKKEYEKAMEEIRGRQMSMIFQDPLTFLNPTRTIGDQICEVIMNHNKVTREEARAKAIDLMTQVGIPSPEKRIRQYPFEFSGGMRQRIIIAIALANKPRLVIADEPTTALDVTIQAQVLDLIKDLSRKNGSSVILITHDLGVVASLCDYIYIMYGGKIVESGTDREIFYDPRHPYTIGLLNCINNPEADEQKELKPIPGSPPDLLKPPAGCPFVDRCEKAMNICRNRMPSYTQYTENHKAMCWLDEVKRRQEEKHD
ncbi:MAG: ABC transporter ATP-binding protein [Solobacterium sp.]|nr:ABC transporter ATP-binding protein [Solobacterium sp.]